jgi:hypothetical protein
MALGKTLQKSKKIIIKETPTTPHHHPNKKINKFTNKTKK